MPSGPAADHLDLDVDSAEPPGAPPGGGSCRRRGRPRSRRRRAQAAAEHEAPERLGPRRGVARGQRDLVRRSRRADGRPRRAPPRAVRRRSAAASYPPMSASRRQVVDHGVERCAASATPRRRCSGATRWAQPGVAVAQCRDLVRQSASRASRTPEYIQREPGEKKFR